MHVLCVLEIMFRLFLIPNTMEMFVFLYSGNNTKKKDIYLVQVNFFSWIQSVIS
jgi:hypothetical protein